MQANEILLPENWPDMVRRAMLNAVSLAHYAMVYTREARGGGAGSNPTLSTPQASTIDK
ncbi:MAG: hypothetical protein WAX69_24895 [Victivallales bacterium]